MGLKHGYSTGLLAMVFIMMLFNLTETAADIDKDKQQCGDEVVGLTSCLPYVGGEAKAPTMDCCNGLKLVLVKSRVCLCILIKDHNDPSLGLKINDTIALGLPDLCHTPYNVSECVSLLHLQSGSPDAKVFTDYAKRIKPTIANLPAGGAKNNNTILSDGRRRMRMRMRWLGVELFNTLILMFHFQMLD